jgi:thiol-disulfide isomerase/thioredoxin
MSYELKIDDNGKIIAISGIPEIKAAIMAKINALKIPEGYQKHAKRIEVGVTELYLKRLSSFFNIKAKASELLPGMGLVRSSITDTTIKELSPEGVETSITRTITKVNYINAKKKGEASLPLLAEAKNKLNYADYYTPLKKVTRKLQELADLYDNEKGSQTIKADIMKVVDSLDKGFARDDYQYLGAKLNLLGYMGDGYWETLQKVPYEYLPSESDINNKLRLELEKSDLSNVKKAMELSFTKFKGDTYYPMNMENTSSTIHNQFGKIIYKLKDRDSLTRALHIITQIEDLNMPIVTEMFKGLKTYAQAKLVTDKKELAVIANTHFNSVFDKAGRYRILIYDELLKKQIPDSVKLAYIDYTIDLDKTKIDMINSGAIENVEPFTFEYTIVNNRGIYKKNLADAYYRKSKLQKSMEVSYLQIAADYLPTQQEIIDNRSGLDHEYEFTPFIPYTELFLASGGSAGMTEDAKLSKYVDMVIMEPERYALLKENYAKVYPKGDFKAFFNAALKSKLPSIPKFSLNERSGKIIGNKDQQNKFVFVDFWGTWCGACIAEIDKIESVHLKNPNPEKLLVTTIACFDKKKNVDDFMAKEKYTYEVLMSDGQVEKDFKIRGYPTKLLLLPNGVYLIISFYSNYNDILTKYLSWDI